MGTSTPRQEPSWGKRGGGGRVTMISRGVEISIAGCVGEMVRVLLSGLPARYLYPDLPTTLTLVTHQLSVSDGHDS